MTYRFLPQTLRRVLMRVRCLRFTMVRFRLCHVGAFTCALMVGSPRVFSEGVESKIPADADWKQLDGMMEKVKSSMKGQPENLREDIRSYDQAAREFLAKYPGDSRRWNLRLFDGVILESRRSVGLPAEGDQIAIMEEILRAKNVDEETRSGASAVRVLAAYRALESGGDLNAWIGMADEHLKNYPVHPADQRIKADRELAQALVTFKDKPVDLKFVATDGRQVDVSKLRGKVVLIQFWASYCEICNADISGVVETYEKLHPKGLEMVGVCLDKKELEMRKFVEANQMTWPQYYDGREWEGELVTKLGVHFVPTLWLVNKSGRLVYTNVRGRLEELVKQLLAE